MRLLVNQCASFKRSDGTVNHQKIRPSPASSEPWETGLKRRPETHSKRKAAQHDCLPSVRWGKNILCWAGWAAKAKQKSLVAAGQDQRTNQARTPCIWSLWVPIHSFNSQQGPPLAIVSLKMTMYYILSSKVSWKAYLSRYFYGMYIWTQIEHIKWLSRLFHKYCTVIYPYKADFL